MRKIFKEIFFETKEGDITNFEMLIKQPYAKEFFKDEYPDSGISSKIFDAIIIWEEYRKIVVIDEYDDVIIFEFKENGEKEGRQVYIDTEYYDMFMSISEEIEFFANINDSSFPVVVKYHGEVIGYIMELIDEKGE